METQITETAHPLSGDGLPSNDNAITFEGNPLDAQRVIPQTPTLRSYLGRGVLTNSNIITPTKYQQSDYAWVMCDIRNMRVLQKPHWDIIRQFTREKLLEVIEVYDLIVHNVNYLFS